MNSFKTLSNMMVSSDGFIFKLAEELAIVIGLTTEEIKGNVEEDESTGRSTMGRVTLIATLLLIALAIGGGWWLQSRALSDFLPWFIGAILLLLLLILTLFFLLAPRRKPVEPEFEQASITYVGQFYWPIGIVPLSEERSVLWDPLNSPSKPFEIMSLKPNWGLAHQEVVQSAEGAKEAFSALLSFSEGLSQLHPRVVSWPSNQSDASLQELAQEVPDIWRQLVPLEVDKLPAAIHTLFQQDQLLASWEELSQAGGDIHHFYHSIDALRAQNKRYHERAENLVDGARNVLAGHGWQMVAKMQEERDTRFVSIAKKEQEQEQALPTAPSESLLMSPADSQEQIERTLAGYEKALTPLDKAIAAEYEEIKAQEREAQDAAEARFIEHRKELDDDKRQIELLDSDILKLAHILEVQQGRIDEYATLIQEGFASLANVPLQSLQEHLEEVHGTIEQTATLIEDVNQKIELEAVEATLAELITATDKAQAEWQQLAQQLPEHSRDVSTRVDKTISTLTALSEKPEMEENSLKEIEESVKTVERVARTMVSWSAAQQNPIDDVVDTFTEFQGHLAALREQRQKLEQASDTFIMLNQVDSEEQITLPDTIKQLEQAFTRFIQLSEDTNHALLAMNDASEVVKKQAQAINPLLQERDSLKASYEEKLAAFQVVEREEREEIRQYWQQIRDELANQRDELHQIQEQTEERLNQLRSAPDMTSSGVIVDDQSASWVDKIVNVMGDAVQAWGQRIAGIDRSGHGPSTEIGRIGQALEQCYEQINAHSIPAPLPKAYHALEPLLCFVPFWYIETKLQPHGVIEKESGRQIHIYPPLNLKRSVITDVPILESLRYEELTRRILTYLRRDFTPEQELKSSLSFSPELLTNAGQQLDLQAASLPLHEIANALAQHWVINRSSDALFHRIIKNTRDYLIPEAQINEALWHQKQPREKKLALPPSPLNRAADLPSRQPPSIVPVPAHVNGTAHLNGTAHDDMRPSERFHQPSLTDTAPIELPPA